MKVFPKLRQESIRELSLRHTREELDERAMLHWRGECLPINLGACMCAIRLHTAASGIPAGFAAAGQAMQKSRIK
jgi:hypothetical protein